MYTQFGSKKIRIKTNKGSSERNSPVRKEAMYPESTQKKISPRRSPKRTSPKRI